MIYYHTLCFLYFQSTGDHPGPAILWGHRHVVPGLRHCWALPGMAPLPRGLRVWSGSMKWFLGPSNCAASIPLVLMYCYVYVNALVCSFSMSVCLWVCLGNWDASPIPPTASDDSCAASLFIWTDATEPLVQLAQPLCSRARHCCVPFSLSVRWGSVGKILRKLCSITEHACLIFFRSLKS